MKIVSAASLLLPALVAVAAWLGAAAPAADPAYRAEVEQWREGREARLKADDGWLTVAGLFWLKEGANRFGSGRDNEIVLPAGAPARAGTFELHGGKTGVRLEPGVAATLGGKAVAAAELVPDAEALAMGRLTLQVIERGGRYGIRLKDMDSARRRGFQGLRWYPVQESYRVTARFVPLPQPAALSIANVLGMVEPMASPGYAVFSLGGRELRLQPVLETKDAQELFFIFKDETAARETYGAGRFLYAAMPKDGTVVLDFNKAYTPPCAFTDYATCPLPPKQNRLPVRIEAGEKTPPGHH